MSDDQAPLTDVEQQRFLRVVSELQDATGDPSGTVAYASDIYERLAQGDVPNVTPADATPPWYGLGWAVDQLVSRGWLARDSPVATPVGSSYGSGAAPTAPSPRSVRLTQAGRRRLAELDNDPSSPTG